MIGNLHGQREIDTHEQDSTNALFQYFFMRELKDDIVLTSPISVDDEVISVSAGHGFTGAPGEHAVIWENDRFLQMPVKSVAVNAITLSHPIDNSYTVDGSKVIRGNINMNINAVGIIDFLMKIQNFTIPIDISKIIFTMFHSVAGDAGKFGGIAALTNGLWFRKDNGIKFNMGNYKNNQDFENVGAVIDYSAKGPAGIEATTITFDIKNIFGQVIRIDPRENDIIQGQGRDDMSGLTGFTGSAIGSYTSGE
jgi:hypothetical protein